MMSALLLLSAVGLAEPAPAVVLHSRGTHPDAVAQVREALGAEASGLSLSPQQLSDLLRGAPQVIGGGQKVDCSAPAQGAFTPGDDLKRISGLVAEQRKHLDADADELLGALNAGRQASKLLPCSRDLLPADVVRDVFFNLGVAASRKALASPSGSEDYRGAAEAAFTSWRVLVPDDAVAVAAAGRLVEADGRSIALNAAKKKVLSASLRVVPAVDTLWIDGLKADPASEPFLSIGDHLVQLRARPDAPVQSMWVRLTGGGSAVLAVPELLGPDTLEWVADSARRDDLTDLLRVFGSGDVFIVTSDGTVWQGELGDPDAWTYAGGGGGISPPLSRAARLTGFAGLGLATASAVSMGVSCLASRQVIPEGYEAAVEGTPCGVVAMPAGSATPDEAIENRYDAFRASRTAMVVGLTLANAGVGLSMASRGVHLGLAALPGGAYASFTWTPMPRGVTR